MLPPVKQSMRAFIYLVAFLAFLGLRPAFAQDMPPHGRLDQLAAQADLVFKGQVVVSVPITNDAFRFAAMGLHATQFKVISVLQGTLPGDLVVLQHYTHASTGPWSGPTPPTYYALAPGETCLIFADRTDKADTFFTPWSHGTRRVYEFRQLADSSGRTEDGLIRTLDARSIATNLPVKDAVWQELDLLLHDRHPSNELYAIDHLDAFSLPPNTGETLVHSGDFKRTDVLNALLPLRTNSDELVANRAIDCFAEDTGIFRANLNDADYRALSVAKLAGNDAGPWLAVLTNIIQTRINYVNYAAHPDANDPRRFTNPTDGTILAGPYLSCWEILRQHLTRLSREELAGDKLAPFLNLLGASVQAKQDAGVKPARELYVFYKGKGLAARAAVLRQKFPRDESWFDEFDREHPELTPARN